MKKAHSSRRILNPTPAKNFRVHRIMEDGTYRVSKLFTSHSQAAQCQSKATGETWIRPA